MGTQIDWPGEIDRAVPPAPGSLDRAVVLAAGHRALRRRRTTIGAGALAGVLLVAGVSWAATGDPSRPSRGSQVATQPSPTAAPTTPAESAAPEAAEVEEEPIRFLGDPAVLSMEGRLTLAPQTTQILERVDNPMDYSEPQGVSVAMRVLYKGREHYSLMVAHPSPSGGSTSTSTVEATGDFAGWLASAKASQHTLDVLNGVIAQPPDDLLPNDWLVLDGRGRVVPGDPRVVLVGLREQVDLGQGPEAVAEVQVAGTTHFVVVRRTGGRALEVVPGGDGFADLEAFVEHVRRQNALGTGLR